MFNREYEIKKEAIDKTLNDWFEQGEEEVMRVVKDLGLKYKATKGRLLILVNGVWYVNYPDSYAYYVELWRWKEFVEQGNPWRYSYRASIHYGITDICTKAIGDMYKAYEYIEGIVEFEELDRRSKVFGVVDLKKELKWLKDNIPYEKRCEGFWNEIVASAERQGISVDGDYFRKNGSTVKIIPVIGCVTEWERYEIKTRYDVDIENRPYKLVFFVRNEEDVYLVDFIACPVNGLNNKRDFLEENGVKLRSGVMDCKTYYDIKRCFGKNG